MDDIEVQGVSGQMQQSVIQGDQDKILQLGEQGGGNSRSGGMGTGWR